jgi:branched-chain amino acid transport system ATP-binding protein
VINISAVAKEVLVTDSLTKKFDEIAAVQSVSIAVEQNWIALLIGPNGCGKTTLINTISGYYSPDSGRVLYRGEDITGLPLNRVYDKGLVRTFQTPQPFAQQSVLDNMLVAARGNPGESLVGHLLKSRWLRFEDEQTEKAFGILKMLQLESDWDKDVSFVDAGGLKLIEIGRALMSDSKMIILDEPIAGVNPGLAHKIFSQIVNIRDTLKITFLIIEHRLDIALPYADHVFVMNQGRLVTNGTPSEVAADENVRRIYIGV